jgi:hypothetical protein
MEGMPHSTTGHNFAYAYKLIALCEACGHGQLEIYSHDCYPHYEDEDWDMYWWVALNPIDLRRLAELLIACPDPLNPACACALHDGLRDSAGRLWGGVRHAIDPSGKVKFAWVMVDQQLDHAILKVDPQAGISQAT